MEGTLAVTAKGISFEQTTKKPGRNRTSYTWMDEEIQQLTVSPVSITVLTYADSRWKLGTDRGYRFDLGPGQEVDPATIEALRERMDRRFVAVRDPARTAWNWTIPAKLIRGWKGASGELRFGEGEIAFATPDQRAARHWRLTEVENISSSGPFDFSITTFERSRLDYGSRREFRFQLRRPLDQARYQQLWKKLYSPGVPELFRPLPGQEKQP
jgi:hypothetical protein